MSADGTHGSPLFTRLDVAKGFVLSGVAFATMVGAWIGGLTVLCAGLGRVLVDS